MARKARCKFVPAVLCVLLFVLQLDLAIIAELYDMEYGVKLYKAIDDECSGGFKKMLIQILGELAE